MVETAPERSGVVGQHADPQRGRCCAAHGVPERTGRAEQPERMAQLASWTKIVQLRGELTFVAVSYGTTRQYASREVDQCADKNS